MTRGIVIFGINNARVDYVKLAIMAASFAKKQMPDIPICLITDNESVSRYSSKELSQWFQDVIVARHDSAFKNTRTYRDTRYYGFSDHFKNESRASVYELSPYDETLLIDCDFLMCNNVLDGVWGNVEDVMINKHAIGLMHNELATEEVRLNPYGIKMYWATVIYFRKSEKAKILFDLVDHIRDTWEFYKMTYEFPGGLFRNDYAFSIAIHIINGFSEGDVVSSLPEPTIMTALDTDQFYGITSPTVLHFLANDLRENWKFFATRLSGINVHCMNKLSLLNNYEEIMETLA